MITLHSVTRAVERVGLRARGAFHPGADDRVPEVAPGRAAQTVVLVGNVGSSLWPVFAASGFRDGRADPLDDWSRAVLEPIAAALGGRALFPFEGPPFHPFLRWARRSERVWPSLMGPLIHPCHGLWHAYRGALALRERLALDGAELATCSGQGGAPAAAGRPCDDCPATPCLGTCPVDAVQAGRFEVQRCRDYLRANPGCECMRAGCLARRACPVGTEHIYQPEQARHHMCAFIRPGPGPASRSREQPHGE